MLIGKGVSGIYILIIMAVALATYIIWRFWEGITAQVGASSVGSNASGTAALACHAAAALPRLHALTV